MITKGQQKVVIITLAIIAVAVLVVILWPAKPSVQNKERGPGISAAPPKPATTMETPNTEKAMEQKLDKMLSGMEAAEGNFAKELPTPE